MSLETVSKLVAKHSGSPAAVQAKLDRAEAEKVIVRSMVNWMIWGMLIVGIGVVMIVTDKSLHIGKWFSLLSSFLVLGGMGVATGGVLNALKRGTLPRSQPMQLSNPPDTKALPTDEIPAELPSVTEATTQLIAVDDAPTNKMMDTSPRE